MNREIRIYRYLSQNSGWQPRDKIMHWTGFPSPKSHPVCAYVEFQNAVMRLNERLQSERKQIIRGLPRFVGDRNEQYQIISIVTKAA